MRRTIVAGFLIGSLSGLGMVAVHAQSDSDLPAEKAHAVKNAGPRSDVNEPGGRKASWRQASADSGAPGDVARLKQAVSSILGLELRAAAMPASVAQRRSESADRHRALAKTEATIWAPAVAHARSAELQQAIDAAAADPRYDAYSDARFVVTRWQGVTVNGTSAEATVLGHNEFRAPGEGWTSGRESQIQIKLTRTGNGPSGWQMLDKSVLFNESEGN